MPSTVDSTLNNTKPSAKPMRVQPNKVVATSPISAAASAIWEISIGDNAAVATDLRDFCWTTFLLQPIGAETTVLENDATLEDRLLDETVGLTDATTVLAVKVSAIFVRIISFLCVNKKM